jgi:hypothetical protein
MLIEHLSYWIHAISSLAPGVDVRAEFSSFDSPVIRERFYDTVLGALQPLPDLVRVVEDATRVRARGYYDRAAIRISIGDDPSAGEIGDGGFTNWTSQLMTDNKERAARAFDTSITTAEGGSTRPGRPHEPGSCASRSLRRKRPSRVRRSGFRRISRPVADHAELAQQDQRGHQVEPRLVGIDRMQVEGGHLLLGSRRRA